MAGGLTPRMTVCEYQAMKIAESMAANRIRFSFIPPLGGGLMSLGQTRRGSMGGTGEFGAARAMSLEPPRVWSRPLTHMPSRKGKSGMLVTSIEKVCYDRDEPLRWPWCLGEHVGSSA